MIFDMSYYSPTGVHYIDPMRVFQDIRMNVSPDANLATLSLAIHNLTAVLEALIVALEDADADQD